MISKMLTSTKVNYEKGSDLPKDRIEELGEGSRELRPEFYEGPEFSREVKEYWGKWCKHPNLDLSWVCKFSRVNSRIQRLLAFTAEDTQGIQGMLIGRVESGPWPLRFGYLRFPFPAFLQLIIPYPGHIGPQNKKVEEVLVKGLLNFLQSSPCDLVLFSPQPEGSLLIREMRKHFHFVSQFHQEPQPIWRGPLFDDFSLLLKSRSKNHRRNLKRYGKMIEQELGESLRVVSLKDEKNWEEFFNNVEHVARFTYQRGLGAGFQRDQIQEAMYRHYFNMGGLRAFMLMAGDEPIAFWIGLLYGDGFYTWATGFNPRMGKLRPGHYLLRYVLEHLAEEPCSPKWVDFGFGDAQYKRSWVNERSVERRSLFVAPTLKGRILGFPLVLSHFVEKSVKSFVRDSKIGLGIKRGWRKLLTKEKG